MFHTHPMPAGMVRRNVAKVAMSAFCLFYSSATTTLAQEGVQSPFEELPWQDGPGPAPIGNIAQIKLPDGFRYLGAHDTQNVLQAMENPVSGRELALVSPSSDDEDWFVVFEFDEVGYVRDDEKDKLDANAILTAIRAGTDHSNEERRRRGWATMEIIGWERMPHYDAQTNNLEWAIRGRSEQQVFVNYNTRLLGRSGVMEATLIIDPEDLAAKLPEFKRLLSGYSFVDGERYAQFREGDKVAAYGLTALVTGGAAAVALKTGLFKKIWKFLVIGVIAVGAMLKKIFGRRAETVE